ncbi:hypothetical protein SSX86_017014 [Deinandra increscens subsp. villosa]|uniref:Transposase n=1 Tax=Deinandra increscens subsp. villosa TaxID=3103831 RepID=A0AAP0D1I4_9ASTR
MPRGRGKRGVASWSKKYKKGDYNIEFDEDMQPVGINASRFMSWLGTKCRLDFSYHIDTKNFEKQKWEDLWSETKKLWNIPNDNPKSLVLKKAKRICTNWRSYLVKQFVKVGETPFHKYTYLKDEHWDEFVAEKTSNAFLIKSEKAKASARANKDFPRVGRAGFMGLKPTFDTRWRQLVASYPYLGSIKDPRSIKWVVARAKRNPQTKLYEIEQNMHATVKKLALEERQMIKDGSYFEARDDPITRVLGPEHGGRTRTVSDVIGRTMVHRGLFKRARQQNQNNVLTMQARTDVGVDASPGFRGSSCASGRSCTNYPIIEDLEKDITEIGLKIGKLEAEIKLLEDEQKVIEVKLSKFGDIRDQILSDGTHCSTGKNKIIERLESKRDCAAALVTKHLKLMREENHHGLMGNIIGIVALLGTASTFELSRLFAEYLGDQMLAVVCKYYKDVRLLESYRTNGKLNPELALHLFARELGQSINSRFHVLCIEDIRACKAKKDVHGNLLFRTPTLSDGSIPVGFLGYAVNMIKIDVDHLDTKTDSGCGLRETLFYRLFGKTQVYKTREDMIRAIPCIKCGAVSLEGGIFRGNGAVSLGCLEPDIIFPVVPARNELLSENDIRSYKDLKLKLKETVGELVKKRKSLQSGLKRFRKRRDLYAKYLTRDPSEGSMICYEETATPIFYAGETCVYTSLN